MLNFIRRWRDAKPLLRAEIVVLAWEQFSALLFISAVFPAAFRTPWTAVVFPSSLVVSALLAPRLATRGRIGITVAAALRIAFWLLSVIPMLPGADRRVLIASCGFGVMAFGIRRAVYRGLLDPQPARPSLVRLRSDLRPQLAENAAVAGIVGGHVMLLFSVAFLRTESVVVFRAWWEIIPALAILGTIGFTLAVRPMTERVLAALRAGKKGDRALLLAGLAEAEQVPRRLGALNFFLWLTCIGIGIGYFQSRPGPPWADLVVQLSFGALFAWGVSFHQRGWHDDALRPVVERLRSWASVEPASGRVTLRRRMLREFGIPLLFTMALSLFASIGMYRTLVAAPTWQEDFNAIVALVASFGMLVLAVGGLFLRAARGLSDPLSRIAEVADEVAKGRLDRSVPVTVGPLEVEGLGKSIEDMRRALAQTIASLEEERASLEINVENRTRELKSALDELKQAQAALVHGERMALIGQLVAGVAHEIYNPLNAVAGSISSLERVREELDEMLRAYREREDKLPAEERQSLEALRKKLDVAGALEDLAGVVKVVNSATKRSVEIVSSLKSFARAPAEPIPSDLREGLAETLSLLDHKLRQLDITVEERHGDLLPVVCRAGEINQVFMNLLTNAIDAIAERAKARGQPSGRILIQSKINQGEVCVTVSDDGLGVASGFEEQIFEPFFTTKPRGQGTGLGLSISRDIVRRHGGTLRVERDPDLGGARFVCRLPTMPPRRAHRSQPPYGDARRPSSSEELSDGT
jgi:signal transduction histidine kinase